MPNGTRAPASATRVAVEGTGIGGAIATLLVWLLTANGIVVPQEATLAIGVLSTTIVGVIMSKLRDSGVGGKTTGVLLVFLVMMMGCVSYDGASYHRFAATSMTSGLDDDQCLRSLQASAALRDKEGEQSTYNGPFGQGKNIPVLAGKHERLGYACQELVRRAPTVTPQQRDRANQGLVDLYAEGLRIVEGK